MIFVLALLAFSLSFQGSRGLWERDEGRYTNIALRMLETGDFIVPSFNDDVPHFAKPPLTYWAIAGGIALLGRNEWGARLPNALAFVATILIVFAIARRIMPESTWLPPLIYATFLFPFSASNVVTTDTLLTLWEALAVLGFIDWWHGGKRTRRSLPLIVMWGGFGLAFLTKGPPGLLPLIAIIVFIALSDGWRTLSQLFSLPGIVLFVAVGFGWYLLVVITHPGLRTYFIKDEFVNRIATGAHHRNPQWYKPFIIYIPVIIFGTIPWTLPLLRAVRSLPETLFSRSWWTDKLSHDRWPVFLVLWIVLPLVVFFMSRSRLPLYILPLFVPFALVIGRLTNISCRRNTVGIYLLAAWIVLLPLLKLAGSFSYPFAKDSREMARSIQDTVQPLPKEVVFVDNEPFWGLNLYLHCEVEGVSTHAETARRKPFEETLSEELSEGEPGTLLVVERPDVNRVIAACRKMGFHARVLGEHHAWFFSTLTPEFKRASKLLIK